VTVGTRSGCVMPSKPAFEAGAIACLLALSSKAFSDRLLAPIPVVPSTLTPYRQPWRLRLTAP